MRIIAAIVAIFLLTLSCRTGPVIVPPDSNLTTQTDALQKKEGWVDNSTYQSYGRSNCAVHEQAKEENHQSCCRRKALFQARSNIIPAFMKSPNAKPSYELQKKMALLLKIIENGELVDFSYRDAQQGCSALVKIEKKGLRSMVEDIH